MEGTGTLQKTYLFLFIKLFIKIYFCVLHAGQGGSDNGSEIFYRFLSVIRIFS